MAGRDQSQDPRREAARRKRTPAPPIKTEPSAPIFGTPVKSETKDDLSRKVQNTLGLYDNLKVKPHELNLLTGVQYQPQTPLPGDSKNISHFPVINGPAKSTGQHSSQSSGSGGMSSSQVKSSPAEGSLHRHANSKSVPAGASSSSCKVVKRESGTSSQLTSSTNPSSSSHNKARSSAHDKAKESAQRRSKDGNSGVRTTPKSTSGSSADSGILQQKTSAGQSSKSDGTPSSSSSTSKPGSSRPSTNSVASRGNSNSSSSSNASDSKTVLHPNGLLTETCHSITNYPLKQSGVKSEQKESKPSSGQSKKDISSNRDLPFISPMPDIVTDFQSRSTHNPVKEVKKERDGESKQRPRLDMPKKVPHQGHSKHKEVEKIFEKMTVLKTPVSAIQTPVKVEMFPFDDLSHASGSEPSVPRKKLVDVINKDIEKKTSKDDQEGKGSSLRNDLRLSDESDNEEAQEETNDRSLNSSSEVCEETSTHSSHRPSSEMKRSTDLESSGSESDAEENTSESEESESEESEADETPPPSPPKKKSYSLMNQIRKVQKEMPQMTPSTPSFRGPPSVENPLSNSRVDPNEGSKHPEQSAESGDNEDNDSFSKYNNNQPPSFTDFHQLSESSHVSKASPSSIKSKGSSKSTIKPSGSSKPAVKRPQARTDNSSSSKTSSAKDTSSSARVKFESSSKESAKPKSSKQSSKSASSGQNKKSSGPGSGPKSSGKTQEKKPGQRAKPRETKRVIKSSAFVQSDSDSEDERTRLRPSPKAAVNTSTSSSSSSGSSSSSNLDTSFSVRQPKVEPDSGKRMPGIKKGDNKYIVKQEPLDTYEYRRPPFDDFAHMDPIVSPIRADFMDEQSHSLDRHPEIKFDKDGKPSVYVRLKRELFDHLPKSTVIKFEQNVPGPSTQKRKDSSDPPEKPSAIVKPVKRKQTELEKEKSGRPDNKRSRLENKSPRRMREEALRGVRDEPTEALEPFVSSESSLDRRQSSDRRGSVSSMTGQSSSRRGKNDCDPHHPSSRSKRDSSRGRDFASQRIHDWTSPERHADRSVEMPHNVALGGGEADPSASSHRNGGLSHSHSHSLPPHPHHSTTSHPHRGVEGEDWRVFPPAESYQGYGEEAQSRHSLELDERQFTADDYLAEGKKLKHLADTQVDKHAKALTYFEAVVYLTSCGNVFELDPHVPDDKAVTMYSDTCEIIRYILKLKGIHNGQEGNSNDNKLAVLCYRCQALLNMHMFKLKRQSAMNLSRALTEHLKGTSSKPQPPLQQNPSSWNSSSRYTGTPSPVSPTPSPAGSVGSACSMGSQGSTSSDLVPSQTSGSGPTSASGPGSKLCNGLNPQSSTVAMPQHIVRIMSQFLTYSNYSLYSMHYWEQADILSEENKDFFRELARECGELTLHSSTQDLVHYVRRGLSNLRRL